MTEAWKTTSRTDFSNTSLPEEAQKNAQILAKYLQTNPYAHGSHVHMIKLLHQGFVQHVYPPEDPETHGDPHAYDLLEDLRAARETMDKLFAMGEDLWADWIQDESTLARNIEERIGVMEKCVKAVQEEYGSTKLWVTYGEWVLYCYESVQNRPQAMDSRLLSEDDKIVGREVFTWQLVLDTWKEGAEQTKWRMQDSHLVWDRYITLVLDDMKASNSQELAVAVRGMFEERLQVPHASWDTTFQNYSTFITTYFNQNYEDIMMATSRAGAVAKNFWQAREPIETRIQQAQDSDDQLAEYRAFSEYVAYEEVQIEKRRSTPEALNAVYERAALRFPSDSNLWEDQIMFIVDESYQNRNISAPIPVLERATRHCPWSGSLWSQYLLSSEMAGVPFTQTEEIKHKATNTGLLDVGGIDEVLKVHTAWCSYLRRRACRADASDEDHDVAEMGIRSSIENFQELANNKIGKGCKPDSYYRLQRIYIKFFSESQSWDSAREVYRGLAAEQGDSAEFWLRFYVWEMMRWARLVSNEPSLTGGPPKRAPPQYATGVLKEGIQRPNLDDPDRLIGTLINHCEDHEDAEELQLAMIEVRKRQKVLATQRGAEAAIAASTAAAQVQQVREEQVERADAVANGLHIGKRKREDDQEESVELNKKAKAQPNGALHTETPVPEEQKAKRDRENATILVQHLPQDITETRVRQFFRDCGKINSMKLLRDEATSAVIEFGTHEEADFAQSRDGRELDGSDISVQLGSGSTIWVTNFLSTADEASLRTIFEKYGEIIDLRLPSLKFNTRRRFCYIQYKLNSQAQAALEMDGHDMGDDHKLVVKISDPPKKQDRSGAMDEGREVYVKNVNWGASEEDVESLFSPYGTVQSVRIPRSVDNKSKGFAFVVFSTSKEATAALDMHNKEYRERKLHVELSSKGGAKRSATAHVTNLGRSMSPLADVNGTAPSPMSTNSGDVAQATGDRKSRTFAVVNVPDTYRNDQMRALAETHGQLVKVSLRPDHQGAIIEYLDERDAGKAQLQLDGHEIVPGRKLRVCTGGEMFQEKAEVRTDKIQIGKARKDKETAMLQSSAPVRRPGQQGIRRRGGLGVTVHRRDLGSSNAKAEGEEKADDKTGGKSQDDFRAMMAKK